MAQQIVKLSAVDHTDAAIIVPLDSDAFFLRPMSDDFYVDPTGRPYLHELVDLPAAGQARSYVRAAAEILGLEPDIVDPKVSYVSLVVPLVSEVVRDLRRHLDERHGDWATAMCRAGATEYTTYGLFARHVQGATKITPIDRRPSAAFYSFEPALFDTVLRDAIADPTIHLGMVHSHLGVPGDAFEPIVERLWHAPPAAPTTWSPGRGVPYGRI
jgi:hypothetical protein